MTQAALTDHNAFGHPAYNSAVQEAAHKAYICRKEGKCFSVYYDGEKIYVRNSKDEKPENSKLVCIAQYWSSMKHADGHESHRVQVRFDGAWSEWVDF